MKSAKKYILTGEKAMAQEILDWIKEQLMQPCFYIAMSAFVLGWSFG